MKVKGKGKENLGLSYFSVYFIASSRLLLLFSLINSMLLYFPHQSKQQQQEALAQTKVTTTVPRSTITTTTRGLFLTYASAILGINIQYPTNWEKIERDNTVVFLSPLESSSDRLREGLDIITYPVSNNNTMSIDKLALQVINNYREHSKDFQLIESKASNFDGKPSHILVYTYTDPRSVTVKAIDIGIMNANKVYVISYYAELSKYSAYLPTIQKMIDSFQTMNSTNLGNSIQTT